MIKLDFIRRNTGRLIYLPVTDDGEKIEIYHQDDFERIKVEYNLISGEVLSRNGKKFVILGDGWSYLNGISGIYEKVIESWSFVPIEKCDLYFSNCEKVFVYNKKIFEDWISKKINIESKSPLYIKSKIQTFNDYDVFEYKK